MRTGITVEVDQDLGTAMFGGNGGVESARSNRPKDIPIDQVC